MQGHMGIADGDRSARRAVPAAGRRRRALGAVGAVGTLVVMLALAAAPIPATAAPADDARAVVERFHDALIAVMRNGPRLGFDGRFAELAPAIRAAFNLPAMTRIATGRSWRRLADADRTALVERFSTFSIASYARNFKSYSDQRFETDGVRTAPGGRLIIDTRLVQPHGDTVALDYLLQSFGDRWYVIDVFLNGTISELAARRSEFSSVLQRDGLDALIVLIDDKIATLRAG